MTVKYSEALNNCNIKNMVTTAEVPCVSSFTLNYYIPFLNYDIRWAIPVVFICTVMIILLYTTFWQPPWRWTLGMWMDVTNHLCSHNWNNHHNTINVVNIHIPASAGTPLISDLSWTQKIYIVQIAHYLSCFSEVSVFMGFSCIHQDCSLLRRISCTYSVWWIEWMIIRRTTSLKRSH